MKKYITLFLLFSGLTMAQINEFAGQLYFNYENYKESSVTSRRFKHQEIIPLIQKLKTNPIFNVSLKGKSAEGREIFLISAGHGETKLFMWSQMHGDESTATMALLDIFNFLSADDNMNGFRKQILDNITIYFMPMVNPDGAELFKRRNSFDIDINRDASRNTTPEGKILKETFEYLKADFGFNLHDQSIYNAAGRTSRSAAISFLAPAANYEKEIDSVRMNAMHLICALNFMIEKYIPGHIGRYNDDHEPRAFGDNFQKMGTSTILIETGGWKNDPDKQFLRKINFMLLTSAMLAAADKSYRDADINAYDKIPFNEEILKDLVLRNMYYEKNGIKIILDISADRIERNNNGKIFYNSVIDDIGDLSTLYGYEDYDFTGYEIHPGKIYDSKKSPAGYDNNFLNNLLAEGYTDILYTGKVNKLRDDFALNIINNKNIRNDISIGSNASFYLKRNDKIEMVFVNGFLYDVTNKINKLNNPLIKGKR